MAEAAGFDFRRIALIAGVVVVVVFSSFFFLIRGCAPAVGRKPGYTLIYSNLELKDAANVIARLKELAVPYEIRDEGRAIAVPKDRADQARLGLAEKNLPAGGVVGWEIFDEARLGATDFDRRIQLIRAISGELSRTIRRIEGVEDVRVQIVLPETKLFAATVAPVTASVMLRLRPGVELTTGKINGIVHLVASSVENLQPENVTVIDDSGRILTARGGELKVALAPLPVEVASLEVVLKKAAPAATAISITPEVAATPEVALKTAEERILQKVQAKKELEQELSGKAQELLNRFYPPNSVIIKVGVQIKPAREAEIRAKDLKIKKLSAVILVDNRIDLTLKLKQATFTTAAAAIGYDRKRGDRIILQRVPFHLAVPPPEAIRAGPPKERKPIISLRGFLWWGGIGLIIFVAAWFLIVTRRSRGLVPEIPSRGIEEPSLARERVSALDQIKTMAERNPERVADILKTWLGE